MEDPIIIYSWKRKARLSARWESRAKFGAVALLALAGATAFGIEEAGGQKLERLRANGGVVTEEAAVPDLGGQLEALARHRFNLASVESVRGSDSAASLLARLQVFDAKAVEFLKSDPLARRRLLGVAGRVARAERSQDGQLERLVSRWAGPGDAYDKLVVERGPGGKFESRVERSRLEVTNRMSNGVVRSSLFQAADEAGLPEAVTTQLAEIFSGQVDFARGLRPGDRFAVVYQALEAEGELVKTGRVVSAMVLNAGKSREATWFEADGARGGYFDAQGRGVMRAYLASPMEFTRVTSGFAMRFHPILQTWRAHKGVDFGAPAGAAVRSVGMGKVAFAGMMGGYGNVVKVEHGNGDLTLYAHLSRVDARVGQRVERGDRVGAVGSTGWATGPHLHFEFVRKGQHVDPLEVARSSPAVELSARERGRFEQVAALSRAQLSVAAHAEQVAAR